MDRTLEVGSQNHLGRARVRLCGGGVLCRLSDGGLGCVGGIARRFDKLSNDVRGQAAIGRGRRRRPTGRCSYAADDVAAAHLGRALLLASTLGPEFLIGALVGIVLEVLSYFGDAMRMFFGRKE